jgi:UDP-N-acetyl-D-mannosaminuronic acid dehydrogenase
MKNEKICVIGLGYVGLTLACLFANKGYVVLGIEKNKELVREINSGISRIKEPKLKKLLKSALENNRLVATTDYSLAKGIKTFLVCTESPKNPFETNSGFFDACKNLLKFLKNGELLIIVSTLPVGTMDNLIAFIESNGLKVGKNVLLAYCPERGLPSKMVDEMVNNDRVICATDEKSLKASLKILKSISKGNFFVASSFKTVELVKLAENLFRYHNIALSNQLALICEMEGIDVKEVIKLANTHPRVKYHNPGCGVGGPCLPKEAKIISRLIKKHGILDVVSPSIKINEYMPLHLAKRVMKKLVNPKNRKILVFGLAYKGDTNDIRETPAKTLIEYLQKNNFEVLAFDPFVKDMDGVKVIKDLDKIEEKFDALVIVTDHTKFKNIDLNILKKILKEKAVVADGRRIFDKDVIEKMGFKYIGVGV